MTRPEADVLLVNLPAAERVQRRWVASYYAPNFLIPPSELMGLASYLRERHGAAVTLIDAVAESLDADAVAARVRARARPPALIVALSGFRILPDDLDQLGAIRDRLPGSRSAIFGYLPTESPEVVAQHPGVDYVIRGEPEETAGALFDALVAGDEAPTDVAGLAWADGPGSVHLTAPRPRIADLAALPFPDHDLVDLSLYNESFVPRPIGVVTSTRGCPFPCTFCVRAYGRELVSRSADSLLEELRGLRARGIRNVRFLDDTFTVDHHRVERLCAGIRAALPDLRWTCLTRLDRLDEPLARAMAGAGCRRIYAGIESANPSRLKSWNKGLTLPTIEAGVAAARKAGIEVSGFFIVGAQGETAAEVEASADFAAKLGLDWVIATRLQYWPGTKLHAGDGGGIELDLSGVEPGAGPEHSDALYRLERLFYRRFYLRRAWLTQRLGHAVRSPRDTLQGAARLVSWLTDPSTARDFI